MRQRSKMAEFCDLLPQGKKWQFSAILDFSQFSAISQISADHENLENDQNQNNPADQIFETGLRIGQPATSEILPVDRTGLIG